MFRVGPIVRMRHVLAVAMLAALAACGDRNPTAPISPPGDQGSDLLFFSKPKLLECETAEAITKDLEIGLAGGTIAIGGTSVVFPEGLLPDGTIVTLTIPPTRFVEIDIRTTGPNEFPFVKPIVTMSYERCNRSDLLWKLLSAWYIDSDTKELLEKMPSFDNKLTQSVTFPASHFSGYAIAF